MGTDIRAIKLGMFNVKLIESLFSDPGNEEDAQIWKEAGSIFADTVLVVNLTEGEAAIFDKDDFDKMYAGEVEWTIFHPVTLK
jgi:hypothetical protein